MPVQAGAVSPTPQWTTSVSAITRDSYGNPVQLSVTISGPATTYAVCLKIVAAPAYSNIVATYDTSTYLTYAPCVKYTLTSSSDSHRVGTSFTFGGPATYEAHWYVPDTPANGGTEVGTPKQFKWANSNGTYSPCPWDPQLQIGVWRPSRHKILNRCQTVTGKVTEGVHTNSLDKDRNWKITYGTTTGRHVEYVMRDLNFLPAPALNSTWTITGVLVCDLYHGWKELHPVFQAKNAAGTVYLTGPQYSTATPSVSGTWSLKSC